MKKPITQTRVRQVMAVVAIFLIGFSVALFKMAAFGIDPFQCFMAGMANLLFFLPFGVMYCLVSVLQFVAMVFMGRKCIGFATFVNILCLGTVIEYTGVFLAVCLGELTFAGRVVVFIAGLVLLCFSSALYLGAEQGISTYDWIATVMAEKTPVSFRLCRITTDSVCVIVGLICGIGFGANVGAGTIITAFCLGPAITFFRNRCVGPFLAQFPAQIEATTTK